MRVSLQSLVPPVEEGVEGVVAGDEGGGGHGHGEGSDGDGGVHLETGRVKCCAEVLLLLLALGCLVCEC